MLSPLVRGSLVSFIASFCILVIEIVAGRLLAPYVGVSLYTWTSIIGVVLAGISAGAWAGGWLADRRPVPSTLGLLLLVSGVCAMLIAPVTDLVAADDSLLSTAGLTDSLLARVVILTCTIFLVPSFVLGMVSPVVVKLAVHDLARTGRSVGSLYAFSTVGSIAGTFTTGFVLIPTWGTRATLIGTGIVLIFTALLFGGLLGTWLRVGAASMLAGAMAVFWLSDTALDAPVQRLSAQPLRKEVIHFEESAYYTIQVEQTIRADTGAPMYALHLDHLSHSYSDPADPDYLEYGYLQMFNTLLPPSPYARLLFIGGGGYTLPRLIANRRPQSTVDVVEIDPAVTRVAEKYFGAERERIRTINEDARWYAMRSDETWDAIYLDAFNDLSVPYHLTTREFTRSLYERLSPRGMLAVNVIDDFQRGRFLASYVRTLQDVFGRDAVDVVMETPEDRDSPRSTYVVTAWKAPQSRRQPGDNVVLGAAERDAYVVRRGGIVLTDDYVPVDAMLAHLFTDRYVEELEAE